MASGGSSSEKEYCFSSESVSAGHPDKVCDCISDAVLDACLEVDPNAKVACETATKTGMVMVFGEITVKGKIDYEAIVRNTLKDIGYDDAEHSIDYRTCNVVVAIEEQSPDIAGGVHEGRSEEDTGAGDQGLMFGYATNETEEGMPMTHMLAHKLARELTEQRKSGAIPWLRPDNKTQITMEVKEVEGKIVPKRVHTVVISAQHSEEVDNETIRKELTEKVVKKVIPAELLDEATRMIINPSGRFVIGGPYGDAGLTGRKIIVDTYGGWGAHGGGAFSGKDPTKVDRSAAYGARWAALSLVKAGLCERALVQLSYAIGIAEPLNIYVNSYGTVKDGRTDEDLVEILKKNFSFTPFALARDLKLKRPQYARTAAGGHFGRPGEGFEWEKPKELTL